jgi:hypothetical protein
MDLVLAWCTRDVLDLHKSVTGEGVEPGIYGMRDHHDIVYVGTFQNLYSNI